MKRSVAILPVLAVLWCGNIPVSAGPESRPTDDGSKRAPGFLSAVGWYLPNRVMDAADIFRLRLKAGPGAGVGVRVTDYAAFYWGRQHTLYVGLPGPRGAERFRWPAGYENMHGIVMAGVDASDDVLHPPRYEMSEIGANIHLGIVGAEAGISPVEIVDFLAGIVGFDPRDDDYPRPSRPVPARDSVLLPPVHRTAYQIEPKPRIFTDREDRWAYLRTNVPVRMQGHLSFLDSRFVNDGIEPIRQPRPEEIVFSVYTKSVFGNTVDVDFKPNIDLDVELPNLERSLHLFIESSSSDDLPGRDAVERDDDGWTLGLRKRASDWNIATDVGIRTKWLPELYTRIAWKPGWKVGAWNFRFEQRLFWESDDGFGVLTSLGLHRWMGQSRWIYRQVTSGRIAQDSDGYEWVQGFGIARPVTLRNENGRRGVSNVGRKDSVRAYGFDADIFGADEDFTEVRLLAGYTYPIRDDFLLGDIRIGPQWRASENWDAELRLEVGLRTIF